MNLPNAPVPSEAFLVTHFLTVRDQVKSREFYAGVLGGKVLAPESPCIVKLANSWIILNNGGGPTPDKPDITLEPPQDSVRINSFLNLRVRYCQMLWMARARIRRFQAASFISPSMNGTPSMTWVMSL